MHITKGHRSSSIYLYGLLYLFYTMFKKAFVMNLEDEYRQNVRIHH